MTSPRWTTVRESEYAWERDALEYVRGLLPDTEPFRAWSNFEFIADDGSINEVDLLVVSLYRVFLIEIKSAPGRVEGDAGTWTWTDGAKSYSVENPILLANRKAKKLKSLLARQHAIRSQSLRMPYVEPVVFLSNTELKCRLEGQARTGVYLRAQAARAGEPHIGDVVTGERDRNEGAATMAPRIEGTLARALARAMEQAGIRAPSRARRVGDYVLTELISETDVYQDWEACHASFESSRRRIRIYPDALQSPETTRAERRRAAAREYRLLDGLSHPGILRVELFTEHERGPALVFEHPAGAVRLDHYLQQRQESLDLRTRLILVRQIAETLQYAHTRKLFHQSLTPNCILVTESDSGEPSVKLFNWQAGQSDAGTEGSTRLTMHHIVRMGLAGETEWAVYLAPELTTVGALDPARVDVFSLGAIAYHVITGAPPAASLEEFHEKLARGRGLRLSDAIDGVDQDLDALIQIATEPETSQRFDVADVLGELDRIIRAVTNLLDAPASDRFANPIDAGKGDELEGGFTVEARLGKGSTAVALLVKRGEKEGVLKVALDPSYNDRISKEGDILRDIRHQNIVELYDVVEVSGHAALFLQTAGTRSSEDQPGTYTLAQRIREEGGLSLDLLQRFGDELLLAVDHLEKEGISHRDIKPDNIGIGQTGKRTLTLVLFDFSLANASPEQIRAGTPPYLDPFLANRKPPRWDPYAERFAAAVTLYEMTTGKLPTWGDGMSSPALLDVEATLEVELFDAAVREDLARFFRKALASDYRQRFDNGEEMRRAWARVFEAIDRPTTFTTDPGDADIDAALAGTGEDTSVATLPLSPRVLNALDRMGVGTLRDLQELPRIRLYRNKGIGQRTVREIRELAEKVARHFASRASDGPPVEPGVAEVETTVPPELFSIDLIVNRLLPKVGADDDHLLVLRALLGFDPPGGDRLAWPSEQELAEGLGCSREEIRQVIDRARDRWTKDRPTWMKELRSDIARLLERHAGVMTREELIGALLVARGSAAPEGEREARASAAAYAAMQVELEREGARFALYRGRDHDFIVATPNLGDEFIATTSARARQAEALGAKADELAAADPLLSPDRALEELATVPALDGERPLPPDRLLRLAAAASRGAALSSRLELYPRGMAAARALKLGAGSLLGPSVLTPEMVQSRIASRYAEAEPLPPRPALDALLEESGMSLRWDAAEGKYRVPTARMSELDSSTNLARATTATLTGADAPGNEEIVALDARLDTVARHRRVLVLTVAPRLYNEAAAQLARRSTLTPISIEQLMLDALREATASVGARWELVLAADAAERTGRDWRNLQRVVDRAIERVERELVAATTPALLLFPGLLARYGRLDLIERLRIACEEARAPGYVLLVASDEQSTMPVIDRVPLPVVHASEWGRIPSAWLNDAPRDAATLSAS